MHELKLAVALMGANACLSDDYDRDERSSRGDCSDRRDRDSDRRDRDWERRGRGSERGDRGSERGDRGSERRERDSERRQREWEETPSRRSVARDDDMETPKIRVKGTDDDDDGEED